LRVLPYRNFSLVKHTVPNGRGPRVVLVAEKDDYRTDPPGQGSSLPHGDIALRQRSGPAIAQAPQRLIPQGPPVSDEYAETGCRLRTSRRSRRPGGQRPGWRPLRVSGAGQRSYTDGPR
jgi:hypothetical protein